MSKYRLTKEIINLSSSKKWDSVKLEWDLDTIYILDDPDSCLCGEYPIKEAYYMNITDLKNKKIVKDFKIILKDLRPMIEDPKFLWNARDLKEFTLRPREIWGNWLVCVVLRKIHERDITIMDDDKGDGFIVDKERKVIVPTEHVCALDIPEGKKLPKGEKRVIDAINLKIAKGDEYARGKLLIVFFDGAGKFYRNKIRKSIFNRHSFEAVFCVGLLESGDNGYSYAVTEFRNSLGEKSMTYRVEINRDFDNWRVTQIIE